jgi:hypothetical protein
MNSAFTVQKLLLLFFLSWSVVGKDLDWRVRRDFATLGGRSTELMYSCMNSALIGSLTWHKRPTGMFPYPNPTHMYVQPVWWACLGVGVTCYRPSMHTPTARHHLCVHIYRVLHNLACIENEFRVLVLVQFFAPTCGTFVFGGKLRLWAATLSSSQKKNILVAIVMEHRGFVVGTTYSWEPTPSRALCLRWRRKSRRLSRSTIALV